MLGRLLNTLRLFRREEGGAILVEMTLLTPLLLTLSVGVFEFGNLIHQKLLIEAGLRDAARYAARCNTLIYTEAGLSIDCAANAENIARFGNVAGTGSTRVTGWDASEVDVVIGDVSRCHAAVVSGVIQYHSMTANVCIVRATATFAYQNLGMLDFLGIDPITLTAVHEERLIRF